MKTEYKTSKTVAEIASVLFSVDSDAGNDD
jgi:hypothetical protein